MGKELKNAIILGKNINCPFSSLLKKKNSRKNDRVVTCGMARNSKNNKMAHHDNCAHTSKLHLSNGMKVLRFFPRFSGHKAKKEDRILMHGTFFKG